MTISPLQRSENVETALRLMLAELGDQAISVVFFNPRSDAFKDVLPTTWAELRDERWLEEREVSGSPQYRLNGDGWMEAMLAAGKEAEFQLRSGTLAKTLKAHVKDRREDVIVELSKLSAESGLSPGWVFNAIESNSLEILHRKRGAQWADRGVLVKIPFNFGMPLPDHVPHLRAQLQDTQEELEHTKNS